MVRQIGLSIIFVVLFLQTHAQIVIKGAIVDSMTIEPIPYVNIGVKQDGVGTVSDQNGFFEIEVDDGGVLITISSIGYETIEITADSLIGIAQIRMLKKDYQIEEIKIVATRFENEESILGLKNKKRGHSLGFGSAQLGSEIGAAINIEKPAYILSANLVLNHANGDSLLFRINIYDFENGVVGQKLLKQNVFIKDKQRKGLFSVDISHLNLILKNDVLLTVEWLRNYDEMGNKGITFDTKKGDELDGIYYRYSSNGEFTKLDAKRKITPCFYFMAKVAK